MIKNPEFYTLCTGPERAVWRVLDQMVLSATEGWRDMPCHDVHAVSAGIWAMLCAIVFGIIWRAVILIQKGN